MIKRIALALCLLASTAWGQTITVSPAPGFFAAVNLSTVGLGTLNSSTDNGAAFNTYAAAQPANTVFELPPNTVLDTTVTLSLAVAGQRIQCDTGAKIRVDASWASGDQTPAVSFAANNTGFAAPGCEIDGSAYGGGNKIAGWATSGSPTGIQLLGRTYVHDLTWYGGRLTGNDQIYVQDYYGVNTAYDCFHAQNPVDTAASYITIKNLYCDRSMVNATTSQQPSVQVWGGLSAVTATFTNGSSAITGTGLPATTDQAVTFTTTGGLPTNFAVLTTYYVLSGSTTSSITVGATPGGTAIVAGSAGTGVQTVNWSAFPLILDAGSITVRNPINPVSGSDEGMEVRYAQGNVDRFVSYDGSIGFSLATGSKGLNVGYAYIKGANVLGFEVGQGVTYGGYVNAGTVIVDGTNSSGTATTTRAFAVDGATGAQDVTVSNLVLSGFTDDGLFLNQGWSNISVSNGQIDASSVTGATYGDKNGIYMLGGSATAGPFNVTLGTMAVHGGSAATQCIRLNNASNITGNLACDGITTSLVRITANNLAVNNIDLNVSSGANNPSSNQLVTVLTGTGTIGANCAVGGPTFIPSTAGFYGKVNNCAGGVGGISGLSDIEFVISGGSGAITTGQKGYLPIDFSCTIKQARLISDQSGSIVIDVWKKAGAVPTVSDTIDASALPTLSSAQLSTDTTLTGWTTSVTAGDIFGFNVNSATTVTQVTLALQCAR